MKLSAEHVIPRGIVHAVSGFPLHFMSYRGNLDWFYNRVHACENSMNFDFLHILNDVQPEDPSLFITHGEVSEPEEEGEGGDDEEED